MECKKCNSEMTKNGKAASGNQQWRCKCGYNFTEKISNVLKMGMTLDQFRAKHDVDYIVIEALKTLDKDIIYEKPDLYKKCGKAASTQGLSAALESHEEYYGKTGGKPYYSHPDTIAELKEQGKLN